MIAWEDSEVHILMYIVLKCPLEIQIRHIWADEGTYIATLEPCRVRQERELILITILVF